MNESHHTRPRKGLLSSNTELPSLAAQTALKDITRDVTHSFCNVTLRHRKGLLSSITELPSQAQLIAKMAAEKALKDGKASYSKAMDAVMPRLPISLVCVFVCVCVCLCVCVCVCVCERERETKSERERERERDREKEREKERENERERERERMRERESV